MWENLNDFRCWWRRFRKCSGEWIFTEIVACHCPLHPQIVVARLGTFMSLHCWSGGILRKLQETWVVDSSFHTSLPSFQAIMTTDLRFEDVLLLELFIYKYRIHLLPKIHLLLIFSAQHDKPSSSSHLFNSFLFLSSFIILFYYKYLSWFIKFLIF